MTYGMVGDGSIADNIVADRYYKPEFQKGVLINQKKINDLADELIKEYAVMCDNRDQPIRMLSGGNMQKVVTAREFTSGASLIIANQPTRGIDIGASDFLMVMHNGRIAAYFKDASKVSEDELGEYMLGVKKMSMEEIQEVMA